jgi:ribosomal-protein-alanine N-acetyltransferase
MKTIEKTNIRFVEPDDVQDIVFIEEFSFDCPWSECDFIDVFEHPSSTGFVAEVNGVVVGYCVLSLCEGFNEIENLAVHPQFRGQGIGSRLIDEAIAHSIQDLKCLISETNLNAHLFFKKLGFKAIRVVKEAYPDFQGLDSYIFEYKV